MSLLRKASIVTTPTSYENGKILSVKPSIVLGNELVVNGDFATDSDWLKGTNWTIANGSANSNGSGLIYQTSVSYVDGKTYKVTFDASITSGGGTVRLGNTTSPIAFTNGANEFYLQTDASNTTRYIFFQGNTFVGSIDNVSVKEAIDADFDFTRNSSATRVNSQGLIEDMQILSGDLVSNGDFSQESSELVTNGDFATDSDWTKQTSWSISGGAANYDSSSGTSNITSSTLNITSGKSYKLKFNVISGNARLAFTTEGSQGLFKPNGNGANNFSVGEYSFYLAAENSASALKIFAYNVAGGQDCSIDNVSVKEVGQNWVLGTDWGIGNNKAIRTGTASSGLTQSGTFSLGKKFKLNFTITDWTTGNLQGYFYGGGGSDAFFDISNIGNGTFTFETTTTTNRTNIAFYAFGNFDGSITNISLIEITSDTNLPRIDYTGGEGHWLFEPQSTNLITQSELFSDSYWNKSGSSVVSGFISPDGTSNAFKLVENTATTTHQIFRAFFYLNAKYSLSVFLKADGRNWIKMNLYDGTSSVYTYFDLTNGVVGQELGASGKIENYGNGWYKCSMSTTSVVSLGSGNISFRLAEFDGGTGYIGDGTSGVYIYGAQLEQNSFATSYIPTEGSIKTRLQDAAFGAGSSDLINSTEGTLYAEISALADDGTHRAICISKDGTLDNMIVIQYTSASQNIRFLYRQGAVSVADLNFALNDITQFHKVAGYWKQNEFKLFINGAKVGEQLSGNVSANNVFKTLNFNRPDGQKFFGKAKCVAVFKEALNNDELECLTGEGYDSFNALALANNYTII